MKSQHSSCGGGSRFRCTQGGLQFGFVLVGKRVLQDLPPIPFSSSSTVPLSGVAFLTRLKKSRTARNQRGGQLLHEVMADSHIGERAGSSTFRGIYENQPGQQSTSVSCLFLLLVG